MSRDDADVRGAVGAPPQEPGGRALPTVPAVEGVPHSDPFGLAEVSVVGPDRRSAMLRHERGQMGIRQDGAGRMGRGGARCLTEKVSAKWPFWPSSLAR